jgi:phage tail sheath protein FI
LKFNTAPNNRLASILNGIGTFNTVSIPGSISAGQTLSIDAGGTSATLIEGVDFTISSTAADLVNVINQHPVLSLVVRAQSSSPTAFFVVVRKPTAIITTAVLDITETGGSFNIGAVNSPGTDVSQNTALYNSIRKTLVEYGSLTLPPSGTMAGIYAAVDNDRGVWKAPANVSVANISGPSFMITEAQQGGLNVDPGSGKSINAIRTFVGRGTLVWGARTLEGNSNEWRYVPVRRLFIMAEESCKKASEFVVFEPNDKNTWIRVKGMITNFLTDLLKQGALAGTKPEQAFFVQVGLGETMTAQDILEGRLIVTIGMAAVRPAEFIILQFTHKLQES